MPRRQVCFVSFLLTLSTVLTCAAVAGETPHPDQVQANTTAIHPIEPPTPDATAESLEERADLLRAEKLYLDALDYYHAALAKKPNAAPLYNKIGIVELLMQRWPDAKKGRPSIAITRRFATATISPPTTATWALRFSRRKTSTNLWLLTRTRCNSIPTYLREVRARGLRRKCRSPRIVPTTTT
jgi:hypothetical protein